MNQKYVSMVFSIVLLSASLGSSAGAFAREYSCAANCGWWEKLDMDGFTCATLKNRAWVNGRNEAVACSRFVGEVVYSEGKNRRKAFSNLKQECNQTLWDDDNFPIRRARQIRSICERL